MAIAESDHIGNKVSSRLKETILDATMQNSACYTTVKKELCYSFCSRLTIRSACP
jgi:hypothetical protein